jgi:hypothetical protein
LRADVGDLELPTTTVIARCVGLLKDMALAQIKEQQQIEVELSDVLWVLTVPAIWPEVCRPEASVLLFWS